MKKILMLVLAVMIAGCIPPKPNPVPTPTPGPTPTPTPTPPVVDYHPELLLKREGSKFAWADGHQPLFEFRERGLCCNAGQGLGWPGFTVATLKESLRLGRVTMMEFRLGPFSGQNEPDWAEIGGGYLPADGGRVDLTKWNEPYWTAVRTTLQYANDNGVVVRFVLVDTWGLKVKAYVTFHDDQQAWVPWNSNGNIQGEEHGEKLAALDAVHDAWIRKAVSETCKYGGVIYEDAVEPENLEGYKGEFSVAIARVIRETEAANGCARHLFGSNATKDVPLGTILDAGVLDFNTFHETWTADRPVNDIPTITTEYNPEPPWSGASVWANYCYSQKRGTYYSAWMHGQSMDEHVMAMGLISGGCKPLPPDFPRDPGTGCPMPIGTVGCMGITRYFKTADGFVYDMTAKDDYCKPIMAEGNGSRVFCELSAGAPDDDPQPEKGAPRYVVEGGAFAPRANPWQITVTKAGRLHCYMPRDLNRDVCGGFPVAP